ncbi:ROK family protein [Kitasatospora viridis]|uniref:Glucokinase n=1 Tax=Kitasatospora viridis TaxID=281105 RepID=A0A561UMX8_9ACTN|nr:ROK family protein [Kitasatospora viridis]TWG00725.1 glucokinase [Kitasatospora viridis]
MDNSAGGSVALVFDLGGTWFRSGILDGDRLTDVRQRPAPRRGVDGSDVPQLQRALVRYLVETAEAYRTRHVFDRVGVSLGAAMNGSSGLVLASAPLWGPGRWPLPLAELLTAGAPRFSWAVLNDVSAQAVSLLGEDWPTGSRLAALTVSTGIAYRTIDPVTGHIPLDAVHGLQGEIGHLPARFEWRGAALDLACDCGVANHTSAFASGRGIERILREPLAAELDRYRTVPELAAGCAAGDGPALELLDACTAPLARLLLAQATLDPTVARTVLMGGVVHAFGRLYRESLLRNLDKDPLYLVSAADPGYFGERILISSRPGVEALVGAGLHALRIGD